MLALASAAVHVLLFDATSTGSLAMAGMPSMPPADAGIMWLGPGLVCAQLALAAVGTAHRYWHRDERS